VLTVVPDGRPLTIARLMFVLARWSVRVVVIASDKDTVHKVSLTMIIVIDTDYILLHARSIRPSSVTFM